MTTILLKVMLLSQRTLDPSYPGVTQDTQLLLTRTIWVSCLSHFLLCSCTQDKFVMVFAPGHAHLHAIKNLHRDNSLASRQIVPRHCASARNQLCKRGQVRGSDQTCTATHVMLNKNCTRTAKSAPYPPCTVTALWPRRGGVPGLCPDASSGNTTSPYCRAVMPNYLST